MIDDADLEETLLTLAAVFKEMEVRWVIGGSYASSTYGESRATNDLDVIAPLSEMQARRLVEKLGDDFYAVEEVAVEATRRRSCFNVIDNRTFIKVDVFVPAAGPLGVGQLDRMRMVPLVRDLLFPVLAPEDVILQKLHWFRLGGETSDRQWRDICSVFSTSRDLDQRYLDGVAASEGLAALLARARADAFSEEPRF